MRCKKCRNSNLVQIFPPEEPTYYLCPQCGTRQDVGTVGGEHGETQQERREFMGSSEGKAFLEMVDRRKRKRWLKKQGLLVDPIDPLTAD
jgi:hypothetical protein